MENNAIIQEYEQLTKKEPKTVYNIDDKIDLKVSKQELKRGLKEKLQNKHENTFIYEYMTSYRTEKHSPNKLIKK